MSNEGTFNIPLIFGTPRSRCPFRSEHKARHARSTHPQHGKGKARRVITHTRTRPLLVCAGCSPSDVAEKEPSPNYRLLVLCGVRRVTVNISRLGDCNLDVVSALVGWVGGLCVPSQQHHQGKPWRPQFRSQSRCLSPPLIRCPSNPGSPPRCPGEPCQQARMPGRRRSRAGLSLSADSAVLISMRPSPLGRPAAARRGDMWLMPQQALWWFRSGRTLSGRHGFANHMSPVGRHSVPLTSRRLSRLHMFKLPTNNINQLACYLWSQSLNTP
jgi:hypothetical protein